MHPRREESADQVRGLLRELSRWSPAHPYRATGIPAAQSGGDGTGKALPGGSPCVLAQAGALRAVRSCSTSAIQYHASCKSPEDTDGILHYQIRRHTTRAKLHTRVQVDVSTTENEHSSKHTVRALCSVSAGSVLRFETSVEITVPVRVRASSLSSFHLVDLEHCRRLPRCEQGRPSIGEASPLIV